MLYARFALLALVVVLVGCGSSRLSVSSTPSAAEVSAEDRLAGDDLFAIVDAGRWGYMDRQGRVVISPRYDYATPFAEGRAAVRAGAEWGYIAPGGTWVIEPTYSAAAAFSDGRALVSRGIGKSEKFGFIDASGAEVVAIQLPYALSYSEGLALVRLTEVEPTPVEALMASFRGDLSAYGYAFLDRDGRVAFDVPGIAAASFAGGLAPFEESRGLVRSTEWGYLDRQGNIAVPATLDGPAFRHTEDLARVGESGEIGFVDREGAFVIEPVYDLAFAFSEGLAPVKFKGKWGFVSASGEPAISAVFLAALPFSEGLAAVQSANGWGYVDASGKTVIAPQFSRADPFDRGLARVYNGRSLRYIDKSGEVVWAQQ